MNIIQIVNGKIIIKPLTSEDILNVIPIHKKDK